jgi:superfamily II RNA helicase
MRLDERIPEKGFERPGDMLDAFLAWVAEKGLELYPHQEEAILELFDGRHVVLDAPTGSGKSLVATALHYRTFVNLGRAWYTAPIKALVSEKFFELCGIFGPEHVGMMTGDGAVNRDAPILACTAEILANLALREGELAKVTSVVMDEFHYYADRERGMSWQIPLLTLPNTQFLLMSATLGDTSVIREDIEKRTGRKVVEVRGVHRPVPLEFSYSMKPEHEMLGDLVKGGKAPVYVVHFTQQAATEQAQALTSTDWCTKEEKKAIADAVKGFQFHSPFGPTVRRYVLHGIGLHHAGLLPRYRLLVERLAQQGLLKVICGTDTLGVGINVPIRTVMFTQLCKFDGEKTIILPVREFKQIAGRAGRAGFDRVGYVVVQAPAHIIENARMDADPKKKKKVRAQPPQKGYKHWDENTFNQLVERPPEALESQFSVDHGRLLMLMQHAQDTEGDAKDGYDALLDLIDRSHAPPARKKELLEAAEKLLEHLKHAVVVTEESDGRLALDPELQRDFSLHHSLSLFLLDAIAALDKKSTTYALDVISWVEAILEHPRPVLIRQVDRAKGELIGKLKAEGVPYEDRMEALEDVSWPKPRGDEIYAFYNAYAEKHPWVQDAPIRPKSVVREMAETYASFAEYVQILGLQRAEGVLLRYLSEAYKALVQNVPQDAYTDELDDIVAYLRAMLGRVDASLVTEWETLLAGKEATAEARPVDISADRKSFLARVRAELHALVKALSQRDWPEAAIAIRRADDAPWGPDEIEAALQPFLDEFGDVGFDHRARLGTNTTVTSVGPHQWEVRQRLWPRAVGETEQWSIEGQEEESSDETTWAIVGRIDLRSDTNPEGPLIELVSLAP